MIPATMRFIECHGAGGPEVLRRAQKPPPRPAPDEVLIRVAAAGVNRPDLLQRAGLYPPPPGADPVLGLEVAGEVVACGAAVAATWRGRRVAALTNGGGYAEYCAVPAGQCLPWPAGLPAAEAAALPETAFTVWHNVFERGALRAGETLLVHGGASGIGTTAIQFATARGATVLVTAGSAQKCAACRALGAAAAIDYKTEDFAPAVMHQTGGRGVDVILDMVGGPYFERNLAVLAEDGRLVFIAFLGGATAPATPLAPIQRKRLTVTGSTLRPRLPAVKAAMAEALAREIWPLIGTGGIRPVIERVFPLDEAAAAHACLEAGGHVGKIVLAVADL